MSSTILFGYANEGEGSYDFGKIPRPGFLARILWWTVGGFLALKCLFSILDRLLALYRRRTSRYKRDPARVKGAIPKIYYAFKSTYQEIAIYTLPSLKIKSITLIKSLPVGTILLIMLYYIILLVLFFVKLDPSDGANSNQLGYRGAWLSIAQLPLITGLAMKKSIISFLLGVSQEKLNIFHRWVARGLLVTTTLHMGYFIRMYIDMQMMSWELKHDPMIRTGIASYTLVVWIVFSSFSPVRNWRYEIFVVQHIISFCALLIMICIHAPRYAYTFIMPSVGFFLFDRVVRLFMIVWQNRGVLRFAVTGTKRRISTYYRASVSICPSAISRSATISIENPSFSWRPGQFIYISFPSLAPGQWHPFTIFSQPDDRKLQLNVRIKSGFTRTLYVNNSVSLPNIRGSTLPVVLDGPYGLSKDFKQFDTAVFLAAGTGLSFTLPLAVDIVRSKKKSAVSLSKNIGVVTRSLRVLVVMKTLDDLLPYSEYIAELAGGSIMSDSEDSPNSRLSVKLRIHLTCESEEVWTSLRDMSVRIVNMNEVGNLTDSNTTACSAEDTCCCAGTSNGESECGCQQERSAESEIHDIGLDISSVDEKSPMGFDSLVMNNVDNSAFSFLKGVTLCYGRPQVQKFIQKGVERARGETGVAVCGTDRFNLVAKNAVAKITNNRATCRGTGAQPVFIESASFGY